MAGGAFPPSAPCCSVRCASGRLFDTSRYVRLQRPYSAYFLSRAQYDASAAPTRLTRRARSTPSRLGRGHVNLYGPQGTGLKCQPRPPHGLNTATRAFSKSPVHLVGEPIVEFGAACYVRQNLNAEPNLR